MIRHFEFKEVGLAGAYMVKPFIAQDERGLFIKDYSQEIFAENGITHNLKEVFYTVSKKGTIRAIHFQLVKQQPKLIHCLSGEIYDVIVDLRKDSSTFGQYEAYFLSGENNKMLLIPEGFGHGYLVIEPAIVSYKCSEKFHAKYDDGIIWNDPDLNIEWPLELVGKEIILSEKDKKLQSLKEYLSH